MAARAISAVNPLPGYDILTWRCPLDETHVFTGGDAQWLAYLNHFEVGAPDDSGQTKGPHRARVETFIQAPLPINKAFIDIRGLFKSAEFVHVTHVAGRVAYRTSQPFAFLYLLAEGLPDPAFNGLSKVDPDFQRIFNALPGPGGTFLLGGFDKAPMPSGVPTPEGNFALYRTVVSLSIQPFKVTEATDSIDGVSIDVRGFVK